MTVEAGYVLRDEYGDEICLSLTEMAAIVGAFKDGPAPDITIKGAWPRLHIRWAECEAGYWMIVGHVHERSGEGDTVIATPDDIATMRKLLAEVSP